MSEKQKTADEIRAEILNIELETRLLDLDEARENNQRRLALKADNSRKNAQRQKQLASDVATRNSIAAQCKHRQGASPSNPYNGKGATALNVARMPDGFTKLIMCSVCKLRVFSPHPANQSEKQKPGETQADRNQRVKKYKRDVERFKELLDMSKDTLTEESSQEMDCGVTISITDSDGIPVLPRRPCDSYAGV